MLLPLLLALTAQAEADAPAAPTAREVVERQLSAEPRGKQPRQSAAESERIRARHLERMGEKLELPAADGSQAPR